MSITQMSIVWTLDLPAEQQQVLLALADHAHDDGSKCHPGVEYLAWKVGKERRTVQRILRRLEDDGLIEVVGHREGGRGFATDYLLHLGKGVKKTPFIRGKGGAGGAVSAPERAAPATERAAPATQKGGAGAAPTVRNHQEPENVRPSAGARGPALAPLVDAFRALGLPDPAFLPAEAKAAQALLAYFAPTEVAACWRDYARGQRGDAWERDRLSFTLLARDNRVGNWRAWCDAGRPGKEHPNGAYRNGGTGGVRPPGAAPRPGERQRSDAERQQLANLGR